ncbi:MAG: SpoIIE family protein phosphatase [Terrimicrobiaceae bacterium]|nr:SpoIIE family protein phosphatase [Terrimicrobiaceae bacterium]
MLFWILGSVSLLLAVMIAFVYVLSSRISHAQMRIRAQYHAVEVAQALKLGTFFETAATVGHMLKVAIEEQPLPPDRQKITKHIADVLKTFPGITGCGYFFEPFAADPAKKATWYYTFRSGGHIHVDDPDDEYLSEEWYLRGVKTPGPSWSRPYVDKGATEELMVSYCVPLEREGKVIGVASVDLSITAIKDQLKSMQLPGSSYYFLLAKDGRFLAIPGSPLEEAGITLSQINPRLSDSVLENAIQMAEETDPVHGAPSWISSYPMSETDLTLAFVTPMNDLLTQTRQLQHLLIVAGGLGLLGLFFVTRFVARSVSRPIEELTDTVKRISAGDLEARLAAPSHDDEIGELTASFNQMTEDIRAYISESEASAAAQARLERDLHISREIQMGLLPNTFPAFPGRTDFDLHAIIEPAREVGGDFYDYFLLEENKLCFVIGDVSDKGIPAALLMAVTKTLVEATVRRNQDPRRTAELVNLALYQRNEAMMFVTLFLGILDLATGRVVYCNAGHNPPLLRRFDGRVEALALTEGAALGALDDVSFEDASFIMIPGDALLLYTDGVTEAMNAADQAYHARRLAELVEAKGSLPVDKLAKTVFDTVRTHAAGAPQSDDIAILAIRYHSRSASPDS